MTEKLEDNQIESDLSSSDLDQIKKQLKDLKNKFETTKNDQEILDTHSINQQISNLESFISGENANIDQAKELVADIKNHIENKDQQEQPQNELDNLENIKKYNQSKDNIKQVTQINISHLSDQKQIDHYVTAQADIVRDRYNQEVIQDTQEI